LVHFRQFIVRELGWLAACALACWAPTPWIAFPAAAVLVLWLPGRMVVRLVGQGGRGVGTAWSALGASIVLTPLALNWVWSVSNDRWIVFTTVVLIDVGLVLLAARVHPPPSSAGPSGSRAQRAALLGIIVWTAACVLGAYWVPRASDRAATPAAHDYVKHHAVMLSLERHPLPLHNVFYAAEADTPYYYYVNYYLLPGALRALSGNRVSIAFAFGLTSAVVAAVVIALVYALALTCTGRASAALWAAACVSIVGGWDLFPVLLRLLGGHSLVVTLDAWCPVPWRVHNLLTQFIWCPQHVSAVLALLLAVRWLHAAPRAWWWVLAAPLLAAAILGTSVYLAMTVFVAGAVYVWVMLWEQRWASEQLRRSLLCVGLMVVLGAMLMAFPAWQYAEMARRYPGGLTWRWERFPLAFLGRLVPPGPPANLLDAPWLLLLDFGLPGVCAVLVAGTWWRGLWRQPGTRLLLLCAIVGGPAMFVIRSDVNPIDYGFRVSIMPTMIVAALCVAAVAGTTHLRRGVFRVRGSLLVAGCLAGLPVGGYEAPASALRSLLERSPIAGDAGALNFLRTQTPLTAVVQGDPGEARLGLVQLADRAVGVLDPSNPHVVVFRPLDVARMERAFVEVRAAFAGEASAAAHRHLRAWGVTHVLVGQIERKRYGSPPGFRDAAYFELLYDDGRAEVYRLRETFERAAGTDPVAQPETAGEVP